MSRRILGVVCALALTALLVVPAAAQAAPKHDYSKAYWTIVHHVQHGRSKAGPNIRRTGVHGHPARASDYRRATKRLWRIWDRSRPWNGPVAASWYGPGFYGNHLGCGGTMYRGQLGVANKTLPCGSKVQLRYGSRTITVPVIDRGPYVGGRMFDLTEATANALGWRNPQPLHWRIP